MKKIKISKKKQEELSMPKMRLDRAEHAYNLAVDRHRKAHDKFWECARKLYPEIEDRNVKYDPVTNTFEIHGCEGGNKK